MDIDLLSAVGPDSSNSCRECGKPEIAEESVRGSGSRRARAGWLCNVRGPLLCRLGCSRQAAGAHRSGGVVWPDASARVNGCVMHGRGSGELQRAHKVADRGSQGLMPPPPRSVALGGVRRVSSVGGSHPEKAIRKLTKGLARTEIAVTLQYMT